MKLTHLPIGKHDRYSAAFSVSVCPRNTLVSSKLNSPFFPRNSKELVQHLGFLIYFLTLAILHLIVGVKDCQIEKLDRCDPRHPVESRIRRTMAAEIRLK